MSPEAQGETTSSFFPPVNFHRFASFSQLFYLAFWLFFSDRPKQPALLGFNNGASSVPVVQSLETGAAETAGVYLLLHLALTSKRCLRVE